MNSVIRATAPLLMALALAACGGGGSSGTSSGSGGTVTNSEGSWLSFTPNSVEVSAFEGESVPFTITATSSRTFSKPFNVAIVDPSGTITTDMQISATNEMTYVAKLNTSPKLPAGVRQANLEVRLCEDAAQTCSKPLPGSPWRVPVKVNVKSAAEAAKLMVLSVQSLQLVTYPGVAAAIKFDGAYKGTLPSQQVRIGIFDKGFRSSINVSGTPDSFKATLTTNFNLTEGEYSSNVEVRMCLDDPGFCNSPVGGSPWILPLKLSVKPLVNLASLAAVPGLGAWSTYQGNAAHTGFVDASFDVAKFNRRFSIGEIGYLPLYENLAVDNGKIFVSRRKFDMSATELVAISEADGTIAWRANLGSAARINPPAVGNGQVVVTTSGYLGTDLWILDQRNGMLLSKTAINGTSETYRVPTVFGADVYLADGVDGGMSKFSSSTMGRTWLRDIAQQDAYTPAVDANNAYAYANGKLRALNIGDGQVAWEVGDSAYSTGNYGGRAVALSGKYAFVMNGGRVLAVDTTTRTVAWSVANDVIGQPAFGNGMVYAPVTSGAVLEVRDMAEGKLQWTSEKLGIESVTEVIVSRNLAFVSGTFSTVAIDLATHKVVWTYPHGGHMAISSNGILYISDEMGNLTGFNLQ